MSFTFYPDYREEFGVTPAQIRGSVSGPQQNVRELAALARELGGDERRVLSAAEGVIREPMTGNPRLAAHTTTHLAAMGAFGCGAVVRFASDVERYDDKVASINEAILLRTSHLMQVPEFRNGSEDPDTVRSAVKNEYARVYHLARAGLDEDADEIARMLDNPGRPCDVKELLVAGDIPMTQAVLFPEVALTDAEKRRAYAADVRNGLIPKFSELPPGTVQQWLDRFPGVRDDLYLFAATPPAGLDSVAAAAWFAALAPMAQLASAVASRDYLGNQDGIPAWARDLANRERIPELRALLELMPQTTELKDKLASLSQVDATIGLGGRQLLLLDAGSGVRLHAAVAIGNVDTADHVAVFTPGFTSTVDGSLGSYDSDMNLLKARSERLLEARQWPGTVATVTWIGYDAPQWSEVVDPTRSVASSDLAKAGGASLADFLKGINDSRPVDPHLTALGHSYGSTTTGYALQHAGTGVDDAIVFGSPGLGTSQRSKIDVPEHHLYRIEAKDDPVADLAQFGQDPTWMKDTTGLSAKDTDVLGRHYQGSTGHSEYLRDGTTSQYNMADTVAGMPEPQVKDDGRGVGDILTWWPDVIPESWR